jgi:glutathione S-transferase
MLRIFFYNNPGWGVPCVSPFVTKTQYYLKMAKIPFSAVRQNPLTLKSDAPCGKLPYIIDDKGAKVADSSDIIHYLKQTYGDPLDSTASMRERSEMHAWNRMIDEHLYWAAIIEPRYNDDANFEIYRPCLLGLNPIPPEINAILDQARSYIRQTHVGQGLGRMQSDKVNERAIEDLRATAEFIGSRPFFMGHEPRSIDATVTSMLKHIMYVPFKFPAKDYALSQKALVDYCQRMDDRFGLQQLAESP